MSTVYLICPSIWLGPTQDLEVGPNTDLGRPSHGIKGLFSGLLLGNLLARAGAFTLFNGVDCGGVGQKRQPTQPNYR